MKIMPLAAAAVLGLGVGSVRADDGGPGLTRSTMIEAQRAAKVQGAPPIRETPANPGTTYFFGTRRPNNQGTWLFGPSDGGVANN